MRPSPPLAVLALLVGCSGDAADTGQGAWLVPAQALGAARATCGRTVDLSAGNTAWFAAEQLVPGLQWRQPGAEIPLHLWDQVLRPTVSDAGTCPLVEASGGTQTWKTYDCRTSQGYELTGELSETRWSAEGWDWVRYDMDLEAVGDTDDPSFDRISLHGALVYVNGDGTDLHEAVQVNVAASAEGLLADADADDPREPVWREWTVTARYEDRVDGGVRLDGDATLGTLGSLHFESAGLEDAGCPVAPDGALSLDGAQSATLRFRGATDCRACGAYTLDGEDAGEGCHVGT